MNDSSRTKSSADSLRDRLAQRSGRFDRSRRVRKRSEFQAIQQRGRRVPTEHCVLVLCARGASEGGARLGITASRRVGNAVVRNRWKRIVREVFRHAVDLFPPDVDVVVIVRAGAAPTDTPALLREFQAARTRIRKAAAAAHRSSRGGEP